MSIHRWPTSSLASLLSRAAHLSPSRVSPHLRRSSTLLAPPTRPSSHQGAQHTALHGALPRRRSFGTLDVTGPSDSSNDSRKEGGGGGRFSPVIESALGTMAGIALVALAGYVYHVSYKRAVHSKMANAFAPGYDPVVELARAGQGTQGEGGGTGRDGNAVAKREEAAFIDKVVRGELGGSYVLILGPKGSGKGTLLVDAIMRNHADGVAMMESHEDLEVFRLRIGKCLDFEFNEDSFAGLFQRKDPREAGPLLDIERALNKLEKVAIEFRRERGRPLVLIINNIHFLHDDRDGHSLLHALQQRAESWAQAGVVTVVFSSDNFHPYAQLKQHATRMHVLSVRDLSLQEAKDFMATSRPSYLSPISSIESSEVYDLVGGRVGVLGKLLRHEDMVGAARDMVESEKGWLLHRLGLIPDLDDDVMDEQKVSSCSFLLFQEFARLASELPSVDLSDPDSVLDGLASMFNGESSRHDPSVTYQRAREIMTRPDYLYDLDRWNIINVDVHHVVRPDSRLMLNVFREICEEPDFQDKLDNVRARVDEIESLHRTSELTVKAVGEGDLGGTLRIRVERP